MNIENRLAAELGLKPEQVQGTIKLLDEGNTIPFIARYRKEVTGELDETVIRQLSERLGYLRSLADRKAEVIRLIDEQGKLTAELIMQIEAAQTLQQVEDLYLPFRPKRRTRATIARERGLEPLADSLQEGILNQAAALDLAHSYISAEKDVPDTQAAIGGAQDILAERVSEDWQVRELVRRYLRQRGSIKTAVAQGVQTSPYEMYYDYQEPVNRLPAHRILAINRGEREQILKVSLEYDLDDVIKQVALRFAGRRQLPCYLEDAIIDGSKRLLMPSIEREVRTELTERAEEQAIKVFADNMRPLLLQAPVKGKTVLAIDPAYRTGCKLAVVDSTGRVLSTGVVYITPPQADYAAGKRVLRQLIAEHAVQLVAIGNGTGSRETEEFVAALIGEDSLDLAYTIVNEAGASVYSASPLAAEELPDLDVTLRGAVSVARRVQDPLAELVKIDPKSIGVGQYQHDVNQKKLAETLGGVVEDVVNSVGVDLNTASIALLRYVAGVTASVAKNIVAYRDKVGAFRSRQELLKVPRLGPAAFTQCAGFLRIPGGQNMLDNTPVHPESYELALGLLRELNTDMLGLANEQAVPEGVLAKLAATLGAGLPTLRDIYGALQRPGRDPREDLPGPVFRRDVLKMEDLQEGMVLPGVVRNVVDFGAFVDIGVKQDGLVHISEIADRFIRHPSEAVQVGDPVEVRVLGVDLQRKRISLSMKGVD